MNIKNIVLFIIIMLIIVSSLVSGNSFVLKENTVVFNEVVRMRDIALMDSRTSNKFGNLIVSVAPDIGDRLLIGKKEIMSKLIGNGIKSPSLRGARNVLVKRSGHIVNTEFFKTKILDYIKKYSKWKNGLSLKILSTKKIVLPSYNVNWKIIPVNGQDFFGNILFKIRAFKGKEEIYSDWIMARLKIEKKVAVSNRRIGKDELIGKDDLRWETREITSFIKNAVFDEKLIVGRRAGRIIRTNTVITTNNLESKYLVRRGMIVSLIANYKSIRAVTEVYPLSSGKYGDYIKVLNKRTKKIITAMVVGRNKMEAILR